MSIRVDLRSAAGAALNVPPLVGNDVLGLVYGLTLGKIGTFTLTVAADSLAAAGLTIARQVWCYESTEGLVFKGIIEDITSQVDPDGKEQLVAVGRSTAASLTWGTTLLGRTFDNQTLATVVSTLTSGTQFTAGDLDVPTTNITTRMDGRTIWESLVFVADVFGLSLREDNIDTKVDIGAFGTASGITFRNVREHSTSNPYLYAIRSIKKRTYALDVANQLILTAQQTGLAGSSVWFSLANSNRSSPYTIQSAVGPDSQTYYYISDSASVAAYGTRQRVLNFREILPLGTAASDLQRAANTLYDEGVSYLLKHKDPLDEYDVEVVGLRHVSNGAYRFQVGDTFRVQFDGNALDSSGGTTTALTVDANLYLIGFTRTFASDGSDSWRLTLSNVLREVPNDGNITAQFMGQLQAVKAAPLPFVLFGDNAMRIDPRGIQFAMPNDGTARPFIHFVPELYGSAADFTNGGGQVRWYGVNSPASFAAGGFQVYLDRTLANDTPLAEVVGRAETGKAEVEIKAFFDGEDGDLVTGGASLKVREDSDGSFHYEIHKGAGVYADIGGDMRATNDGAYFLPPGPERGQYFANDYTTWRPLSELLSAIAPTTTTNNTTLTAVAMPATVDAGDLLLAFCASYTASNHATPSGWTQLAAQGISDGGGAGTNVGVFYKVAAGNEDGTTLNFSAGAKGTAHVYRIPAGTYTGTPVASTQANGSSSTPDPNAVSFTGRGLFFSVSGYQHATGGSGGTNATHTITSTGILQEGLTSSWSSGDSTGSNDPSPQGQPGGGAVQTWVAFNVAVRAANNAVAAATTITNLIVSPAATPDYIQIELATGAPGAETSIGEHKIVPGDVNNFIPIDLSSGDRISARISGGAAYLSVQLLDKADQG